MRVNPLDIGIALALAASFAALGELLLARRSNNLFSWNESFLVGSASATAAFFPLSLVSPRGALHVLFWLLAAALVIVLVRRLGASRRSTIPPPSGVDWWKDPIVAFFGVGILYGIVCFALMNFRFSYFWDGFQVWATKAQMIHAHGALHRDWFPEDAYDSRILVYPNLVPIQEALLSVGRGGFDFDALKPVFLPLYISLLLATYDGARSVGSLRSALGATFLVALLPGASGKLAAGGYSDMPQAAFVAGAVAAALRSDASRQRGHALPWLIGGLTMVKSEGTILACVACLGVLAFCAAKRDRCLEWARGSWRGIAIVAAFLATRFATVRWLGVHDITYGPLDAAHWERAQRIAGTVARECLHVLVDPKVWGFFWPAFAVAALFIARGGTARARCLVLAVTCGIAANTAIFLFTNWDPALQIRQAYPRLLLQQAPAAAVVIAAAYERARTILGVRILPTKAAGSSP